LPRSTWSVHRRLARSAHHIHDHHPGDGPQFHSGDAPEIIIRKTPPTKNIIVRFKPPATFSLNNEPVPNGKLAEDIANLMVNKPDSAVIYADKAIDVASVRGCNRSDRGGCMHSISLTTSAKSAACRCRNKSSEYPQKLKRD